MTREDNIKTGEEEEEEEGQTEKRRSRSPQTTEDGKGEGLERQPGMCVGGASWRWAQGRGASWEAAGESCVLPSFCLNRAAATQVGRVLR